MKQQYRKLLFAIEKMVENIVVLKTWIFEWIAIIKKRNQYKNVKWSHQQKSEFDQYWKRYYGKKISPRWHKFYQSVNGVFDIRYCPEIIFSTQLEPKFNRYSYAKVLQDKALVEMYLNKTNCMVPETIIARSNGVYRDRDYRSLSSDDVKKILSKCEAAVLKPSVGTSSGEGVKILHSAKDIEREVCSAKGDFVLQEIISQHPEFAKWHPKSINTIRMMTYIFQDEVRVCPITFRIGVGDSMVDNSHAGGLIVSVSCEGELGKMAYRLNDAIGNPKEQIIFPSHPDTKIKFEGQKLPNIPQMIEEVKKIHLHFPEIKAISFDLSLSQTGKVIVIETNLWGQSAWMPQIASGNPMYGNDTEKIIESYLKKS